MTLDITITDDQGRVLVNVSQPDHRAFDEQIVEAVIRRAMQEAKVVREVQLMQPSSR